MNTKYWIAVITLTFTIMITGCSSDGDTKYVQEPIHELWKSGGLHVYQDPLGNLLYQENNHSTFHIILKKDLTQDQITTLRHDYGYGN